MCVCVRVCVLERVDGWMGGWVGGCVCVCVCARMCVECLFGPDVVREQALRCARDRGREGVHDPQLHGI